MSSNIDHVIARIERAFAGVQLEDGVSLREADVIDDHGSDAERQMARAKDETMDWRLIPDDLLSRYEWTLTFFDAKGLRFHLPALMRFALRHYKEDCDSIGSTIYELGRQDERFGLLTSPQRVAIRHFLKFMAFNGGRFVDTTGAKKALDNVWTGTRQAGKD